MKDFEATMRVIHVETWTVQAESEADARMKLASLAEEVETDETGGEVVDWEVSSIRHVPE